MRQETWNELITCTDVSLKWLIMKFNEVVTIEKPWPTHDYYFLKVEGSRASTPVGNVSEWKSQLDKFLSSGQRVNVQGTYGGDVPGSSGSPVNISNMSAS